MTRTRPEAGPDEVAELAATSTRHLLLVAAGEATISGVLFAVLSVAFLDREAGIGGAIAAGLVFAAFMFLANAGVSWSRRRKARQGRHWQHDD